MATKKHFKKGRKHNKTKKNIKSKKIMSLEKLKKIRKINIQNGGNVEGHEFSDLTDENYSILKKTLFDRDGGVIVEGKPTEDVKKIILYSIEEQQNMIKKITDKVFLKRMYGKENLSFVDILIHNIEKFKTTGNDPYVNYQNVVTELIEEYKDK